MSDKLIIDAYQQEAVDAEANSIVTAGAGSGKTLVLSLRFLRLLRQHRVGIDEILTLTFTRKAAAQMRSRIRSRLMEMHSDPHVAQQLERFDMAAVSTIDSFCASVLRSDCLRYGISPGFVQDNQRCQEFARQCALDHLLETQEHPAVGSLLRHISFEGIIDEVLLPFALQHSSMADPLCAEAQQQQQEAYLLELLERFAQELLDIHEGAAALDDGRSPGGTQTVLDTAAECASLLRDAPWLFARQLPDEQQIRQLMEGLARLDKMRRPTGKHPAARYFNDLALRWNELAEGVYQGLLQLADRTAAVQIFTWLEQFEQRFQRQKRSAELLTFGDVAELAVDVLKHNRQLRQWYKRKFRYIMIDEFQDNNSLQKDLLYLLAEREDSCSGDIPGTADLDPGKLFFVGDEKQSVYRFRGADVSVFKGLKEEITRSDGKVVELKKNYRSSSGLIDLFNRIFASVMGTDNPPWEADFSELIPGLGEGRFQPAVTLMFHPRREEHSGETAPDQEAEAWHIAQRIRQEVEQERREIIGEDGRSRPMRYEDIALLLRITSSQLIYEKAFRRAGIPYNSEEPRSLFLESPVNDLYLFLQLAAYPMDRKAYAGLLRSPFCRLDDIHVMTLISSGLAPFELPEELSLEELQQEKLDRCRELYRRITESADRVPVRQLIRELWYAGGYRYAVLRRGEYHPYLEFYDYLCELAEGSDSSGDTLAQFVDRIRVHLGSNEKLQELKLLRTGTGGVSIMTVHKAKGLEFPVVILANAGGGQRGNRSGGVYWSRRGGLSADSDQFLFPKKDRRRINFFNEAEQEQRRLEEEAELKRLFYVALTRAMQWCIVSGVRTRNNSSVLNPLNMLLEAAGADLEEPDVRQLEQQGIALEYIPPVTEEELRTYGASRKRRDPREAAEALASAKLKQRFQPKVSASVTDLHQYAPEGLSQEEPAGAAAGDPLVFGTLCHRIIEHRISRGEIPEADELAKEFDDDISPYWQEAVSLAEGFFRSPAGDRVFRSLEAESEVPFVLLSEGEGPLLLRGQIDLLLHFPESCEVIDFKTDRYVNPGAHELQLRTYCDAARRLTGRNAEGTLYYLRTGETWRLPEGLKQEGDL